MKAGVITFHSANNYGAVLQTWALQKVLKDYGIDAGVINYHPDVIDRLYDPMMLKQGVKRRLKKLNLSLFHKASLVRYNKYKSFLSRNFNLIGDFRSYDQLKNAGLNLDAYITGSDQVWNPTHIGGFDPAYYLNFAEEGKIKLSYAASIGSDFIHPKYKEDMRDAFRSYTSISVRESSIIDSVKELTDKKVDVVLDPTMLLTKKDYEAIKVPGTIKEPYILVYMMEKNEQVVSFANMISISLGLPVIYRRPTAGATNQLKPFYTADTGEFLGLIEAAEYVITNSFHATVFSILYERPFVSMLHSDTGSRTVDLLTSLGLKSHILYNVEQFTDFSMFKIENPRQLRRRIDELKKTSSEFLLRNLGLSDQYEKVSCPTGVTKENCCGCSLCMDVCRAGAITMQEDKQGFLYPVVDEAKCTNCGLCNKLCISNKPQTVQFEANYPKSFVTYNMDNAVRKTSSSGAVFPALAKYAIEEKKGVVVGVRYDENMKVISDIAEDMESAKAFRGSKYVKSDFTGMYAKVKALLNEGRYVLYTGLPCECSGLRAYLRKDYPNLLISELVCHAAPSPKVFKQYIEYLSKKYGSKVKNLEFRNKKKGWKIGEATLVVTLENGKTHMVRSVEDPYFRAFLDEFIIRPSCNNCNFTYDKRAGDITLGDCWGIQKAAPELFDNKGVSMVVVNNSKGEEIWNAVSGQFKTKVSNLKTVYTKNHTKPSKDKRERVAFFNELEQGQQPIEQLLAKYSSKKVEL